VQDAVATRRAVNPLSYVRVKVWALPVVMTYCLTLNATSYILDDMIKNFRCKDTLALFESRAPKRFRSIANVAERKLQMLDSAKAIEDLRSPPGNRLEALRGNLRGTWSIRINDQWRLCFRFEGGDAFDVEIVDYH
jgi:toxin HigB-1